MCDLTKAKFYLSFIRFITNKITLKITTKVFQERINHIYISLYIVERYVIFLIPKIYIGSFQTNHMGYSRPQYFFRASNYLFG